MILTFIETRDGKIKKSSLETLSEAKRRADEMGWPAAAVLVGGEGLAPELHAHGAARVFVLENAQLDAYSAQGYAMALADLVRETAPAAVFFAASAMGKDLAPRLAARLGVSMASDCTKLAVKDGALEFTRPIYAGKAFLTLALKSSPALATLRPNVFPVAASPVAGEIVKKTADMPQGAVKGRVAEVIGEAGGEIDVAEAEIIISGGRGLKAPGKLRPSARAGGDPAQGRRRRVARGRRCRLDRPCPPGRTDRQDRLAQPVSGLRRERGHPASGRDVFF